MPLGRCLSNCCAVQRVPTPAPQVPALAATVAGLVGWYDASNYTAGTTTWTDLSGNNNHATISSSVTVQTDAAGFKFLRGSTSDKVNFPSAVHLQIAYTLFHVARYTPGASSSQKQRIFTNTNPNMQADWLSGYKQGSTGVSHKKPGPGWITPYPADIASSWMVASDTNTRFRAQGVQLGVAPSYSNVIHPICISCLETSLWDVAVVIVFDRALSTEEIITVEDYLASSYNVTLNRAQSELQHACMPRHQLCECDWVAKVCQHGGRCST